MLRTLGIKERLWQTSLTGSSSLKIYSRCLCNLVLQTRLYLAQNDRQNKKRGKVRVKKEKNRQRQAGF